MSTAKRDLFCNPEVWGGIECSICRVNDSFSDQLAMSGHYGRPSDIAQFARLGITALRYPVLWERHQAGKGEKIDWTWTDARLEEIREHAITPIAGLVHHGSGPVYTSLEEPGFAMGLAAFAGQVAVRYPWIENYTPVNEPLTTARFSGLYGIWYPHRKDALSFANMLLNQVKAIVLSMKVIRAINPSAKLIQTEDLAKIYSTPTLAYQADFENERRWLTYDLLCGRVGRSHPLWDYLLFIGIKERQLHFFMDNPCIPDILGVNHYVTSERWLDEDLSKYPTATHGGNGRDAYADVEAVRVIETGGLPTLLEETHRRYGLPIAITEAHLNCTREEQLRWLNEIWTTACRARRMGMDIRSVTAWALTGAYDWDSLLTRQDLHYESGAFAVSPNRLKITAVGHLIRALARDGTMEHALLKEPGWWNRRGIRLANRKKLFIFAGREEDSRPWQKVAGERGIGWRYLSVTPAVPLRGAWGVVEIVSGGEETGLEAFCFQQGVPYLRCPPTLMDMQEAGVQLHALLDLFIDQVMAETAAYHDRSKSLPLNYG